MGRAHRLVAGHPKGTGVRCGRRLPWAAAGESRRKTRARPFTSTLPNISAQVHHAGRDGTLKADRLFWQFTESQTPNLVRPLVHGCRSARLPRSYRPYLLPRPGRQPRHHARPASISSLLSGAWILISTYRDRWLARSRVPTASGAADLNLDRVASRSRPRRTNRQNATNEPGRAHGFPSLRMHRRLLTQAGERASKAVGKPVVHLPFSLYLDPPPPLRPGCFFEIPLPPKSLLPSQRPSQPDALFCRSQARPPRRPPPCGESPCLGRAPARSDRSRVRQAVRGLSRRHELPVFLSAQPSQWPVACQCTRRGRHHNQTSG